MPISDKYKVIFVHIPKTAGTSIEKLLEMTCTNNPRLFLYEYNNASEQKPAYQHFLPISIKKVLEEDGRLAVWSSYAKFIIIRNPYERLVSTFYFLNLVRRTRKIFCSHVSCIDNFFDFVLFVSELVQNIEKSGNDEEYDKVPFLHHLRPQHHWFRSENNVYDAIIPFENLEDGLRHFFRNRNIFTEKNIKIPFENVSSYKKNKKSWISHYALEDKEKRIILLEAFEKAYGKDKYLPGKTYETLVL